MQNTLVTVTLKPVTCCNCGVLFGMDADYMAERKRDHKYFTCPNGHSQHWSQKTEAEKLRDQLTREKHLREQAQALAEHRRSRIEEEQRNAQRITRRLNATRGVVTRHKKKIAAGRCPCCSTQFKDLKRHMATRHPNWDPEKEAEVRAHG
jgi:hypothetical protein